MCSSSRRTDQEVRLEVLARCLRLVRCPASFPPLSEAVFQGKSSDWRDASDPNFQRSITEHGIGPDTEIIIWKIGEDRFMITRPHEIT